MRVMHLNVCLLTHCVIVTCDGVTELLNFGSRNDYLSGSTKKLSDIVTNEIMMTSW